MSYFAMTSSRRTFLTAGKRSRITLKMTSAVLEREAGHDQTALAGRAHEAVGSDAEVAEDLAETLGLALLGAAQHGEELRDGLQRHDRMQEQHARR